MTSIDPGLRADAVWVGLAVSSLDTKTGTWAQVCGTAHSESQVPGVIRLVVDVAPEPGRPDHAWIVGDRRGLDEFGTRTVHSTHGLSDMEFNRPFAYGRAHPSQLFDDTSHRVALERMHGLHYALHAADHFARPPGRPAYGTLWREAAHATGWQPT